MNKILIATDFSKASQNAENFAAEMALIFGAKLELIHIYQIPVLTGEISGVIPTDGDFEDNGIALLQSSAARIHKKYGLGLEITWRFRSGYSVDETLRHYIDETPVDLLVMGIEESFWKEKLLGSPTTGIIHMSPCNVLVIHESNHFKRPEKIVLACEKLDDISSSSLQLIKELAELFMSEISFLVIMDENHPKFSKAAEEKIRQMLKGVSVSFREVSGLDIPQEIEDASEKLQADMLIVIKKKHKLIDRILKVSTTKILAYHANTPLLVLHN